MWLNNSRITTNPLALRLRAGWNHLEFTSDNQSQDTGFTIPLPLANHVAMMNSAPLQTFTVSGKVVDPDRRPASQVEVFAFDLEIGSGGTAAITDANGAYRLILLVGRSYNIIYNPPCRMGLATQSRQGISRARLALNVTLPAGLSIDGSIGDQRGTPVPGGGIFAYNTATGIGFGLPPADAQGHYCISLEQGTYELTYTPPPRQCLGPTAVTLALSENRSLHISYPAGFTVAGTLKAGSGNPLPGSRFLDLIKPLGALAAVQVCWTAAIAVCSQTAPGISSFCHAPSQTRAPSICSISQPLAAARRTKSCSIPSFPLDSRFLEPSRTEALPCPGPSSQQPL